MNFSHLQYDNQQRVHHNNLGMQLGTDLSTSHVENNFIGTGFALVPENKLPPPSAAIFNEYLTRHSHRIYSIDFALNCVNVSDGSV